MKNDDNDNLWLTEDVMGQVGYVPAAYLMIVTTPLAGMHILNSDINQMRNLVKKTQLS